MFFVRDRRRRTRMQPNAMSVSRMAANRAGTGGIAGNIRRERMLSRLGQVPDKGIQIAVPEIKHRPDFIPLGAKQADSLGVDVVE